MRRRSRFVTFFLGGIFSVTVMLSGILLSTENASGQRKNIKEIARRVESKYLPDSKRKTIRVNGDYIVERGRLAEENIIVTNGNAVIDGEVMGSVITIDGDIKINRNGMIRGNAIAVSGDIIRRSGSVIVGDEIQTSWRNFAEASPRSGVRRRSRSFNDRQFRNWDDDLDEDFHVRYNRVEGLFLGMRIANPNWNDGRVLYLYGDGGYGFKSEKWRYSIGLERRFFYDHFLTLGVKAYDLTDSDDFWRLSNHENSLAAFFLREDFFDFYSRRGFTGYVSQQIDNLLKFQLEYRVDTFESMETRAHWSLFGGDKVFRPNPSIIEGDSRSINFSTVLDTRSRSYGRGQGWFVRFDVEYTHPDLESDFDYERYILDVRSYQPLSRYENLNIRLMLGSSKGLLPVQRGFYLGGIGTLRGFKFKQLAGTSVIMGNIEYVIEPTRVMSGPPSWILDDFKFAFFSDIGAVEMVDVGDFSDLLDKNLLKHNVGIGILTQDEDFRLDFVWRTDKQGEPLRLLIRLTRPF